MAVVDFNERRRAAGGLRPLPANIEAEQALLGAMLINNDAFYRVSDFLLPEHFFYQQHRELYELCESLIRAGKGVTPVTLKTLFGGRECDGITGDQYMASLVADATTILNAGDYGRVVYDLARRRGLISIAEQVADAAYNAPVDD